MNLSLNMKLHEGDLYIKDVTVKPGLFTTDSGYVCWPIFDLPSTRVPEDWNDGLVVAKDAKNTQPH
jgi:hypothetical protein